jgi:hypothetical protein
MQTRPPTTRPLPVRRTAAALGVEAGSGRGGKLLARLAAVLVVGALGHHGDGARSSIVSALVF